MSAKPTCGVYGLFDPRDGHCVYVGQSVNVERRIKQHLESQAVAHVVTPIREWARKVRAAGAEPEGRVFAEAHWSELNDLEERYVREFKSRGQAGLNTSLTGRGSTNRIGRLSRDGWVSLFERGRLVSADVFALAGTVGKFLTVKEQDEILKAHRLIDRAMSRAHMKVADEFPEWGSDIGEARMGRSGDAD